MNKLFGCTAQRLLCGLVLSVCAYSQNVSCSTTSTSTISNSTWVISVQQPQVNSKNTTFNTLTITSTLTTLATFSLEADASAPATTTYLPVYLLSPKNSSCTNAAFYNSNISTGNVIATYTQGVGNNKLVIDLSKITWGAGTAGRTLAIRSSANVSGTASFIFLWSELVQ